MQYNSVTAYVDHGSAVATFDTNEDARLKAMWFGKGYSIKVRAFNKAMDLLPNQQN